MTTVLTFVCFHHIRELSQLSAHQFDSVRTMEVRRSARNATVVEPTISLLDTSLGDFTTVPRNASAPVPTTAILQICKKVAISDIERCSSSMTVP